MNQVERVIPIINHAVRGVCTRPYPGHPRGCPNYGKRNTCPPQAPLFEEFFAEDRPFYLIYNVFPIGEHIKKMSKKHKEWSERQLSCCLYWQSTARKQLKNRIDIFLSRMRKRENLIVETVPEALGVDITGTMKKIGITLEWPPRLLAYQVALAGYQKGIK